MKILNEFTKEKLAPLKPFLPYGVLESWEDLDPRLYHAVHIYWLKFYGLWYNTVSKCSFRFWTQIVYGFLVLWLVCFLPGIGEVVYLLRRRDNIGEIAEGLYLFLSEMYTYIKLSALWLKKNEIIDLLEYLHREEFKPSEPEHREILRKSIKTARMIYYKPATCIIDGVMDTILSAFIASAIGQIEILAFTLRNFNLVAERRRKRFARLGDIKSDQSTRYYVRSVFKDIIKHHNSIIRYVSLIESAFSLASALQLMLSVMVLCLVGIQFLSIEKPMSHPIQIAWMAIYLTCMLIEVFIICWFGDELIWKRKKEIQVAPNSVHTFMRVLGTCHVLVFKEHKIYLVEIIVGRRQVVTAGQQPTWPTQLVPTITGSQNANEVSGSPEIEPTGSWRATGELRQRVMIAHHRPDASGTERRNSPVVMSVEMDYYNWNVSYPAITLCPASNIDQDVFSALVNETRNKTGKNLHSYYWSLGTISLETVDQIAVQTADVVKLLHTKDYAEIAAMLFESFDNGTFMTNINEPISIEPALTEMGMCHVINSNVAVLHNPIKWKDEAAAYVKNNIEISAHDVDFYTQIMNYAEVYKVYVHSPDEIAISTTPSFTYEAEGLLLFGYQYEPFYINDTHFNYISDHEKICDFNELLCVIRYKNEIIRLAPSNDTIAKFGHFSSLPRSSSDCGCLGSCEAQEYLKDQENFLAQESTSKLRIAISTFPSPIAKASNATNVVEGALEKSTVTEHCGPLSRRKALVPWKRACRMYAHITDPDFVLEEPRYERAYNYFQSLVADCSEKETHDALNNAACKNHEEVSLGMLMSILTEPHNATKCYRDLTLITRDGLTCVLNNLSNLILESSLQQIIEKRVLPNLQPLFDSPKLDRELRTTVRETFKEFCSNGNGEGASGARDDGSEELPREPDEPAFSDDEEDAPPIIAEDTDDDDLPLSEVRARERPELAAALPLNLRPLAETLLDDRSAAAATALLNACSTSMPTATALADLFTAAVQEAPALRITANPTPAELDNAVNSPIFSMFNFLKTSGEGAEAKRKLILETFKEIRTQNTFHGVGYCLLFYLKVCFERDRRAEHDAGKRRNVKFKSELYRDYCSYLEVKIGDNLADDLEKCQECDANVLVWLIPDVYREFKDQAQNHIKLLHVIVSTVDAGQLQRLVCLTLQNNLMMFKSDDITTMLSTSLGWETFEQYCLWQLLTAHDISLEDVLPIIPKLSYKDHAEALTSVLLMLKQGKPSADVLRQLFCRSVQQEDTFVVSTLLYWCQDYEDKVGDLVSVLLSTRYPGTSPNKRKRPGKHSIPPNAPPSAELVLGHLEQMRVNCVEQDDMSIFNMECMQKSLQLSQSNSSDSLRRQYSELFLLAWEDELPISRRARKLITNSLPLGANLHSSNDDSEEEEIVKPKQAKRRKKAISDSD
ncbi:hypothetical protein MSG28_012338 [Choristoneura fumiferana]|uniref:Uncharacterized protein n=1 Tax=Choristoneura fumiferana TaxID=7141 RepID=A0ACC0KDE7_CHOFU|nr:hypothetical protein MSG28_012338 [Choristoneura fumiferana]